MLIKAENFQLLFNACSVTFIQTSNSCISDLTQADVFQKAKILLKEISKQSRCKYEISNITAVRKYFMLDKWMFRFWDINDCLQSMIFNEDFATSSWVHETHWQMRVTWQSIIFRSCSMVYTWFTLHFRLLLCCILCP